MCQLYFFIAPRIADLGDAVPQTPWDFSLFRCSSRRGSKTEPGSFRRNHPALLLLAASRRRSGCVPAEPYPPLKQHQLSSLGSAGNKPTTLFLFCSHVSPFARYKRLLLLG